MIDNLGVALQITAIGMGLVFGAIILLWLLMVALVSLTADRTRPEPAEAGPAPLPAGRPEQAEQAAAAAVAVALLRQRTAQTGTPGLPPTATITAWQAVMRGRQLKHRGPIR